MTRFTSRTSLLLTLAAVLLPAASAGARTRDYWIAAVPTMWNVVPNGHDPIMGMRFDPAQTTFQTTVYRRFTRDWKGPSKRANIPGPLLRARVGDRLRVHFKNLDTATRAPHSMHFHGFEYRPSSDGAFVPGFSGRDAVVEVGQRITYRLTAGRDSAGVWPYHDHSKAMEASIKGGMYGAISILRRHERRPDREFVVFFENTRGFDTINGRGFVGNTPVRHARVGDRVQWDVLALGDAHHTFHVHGHRWLRGDGVPEDTRTVGPAESFRVRWTEDAPGTWLYHCHVEAHMANGMIGLYRVRR